MKVENLAAKENYVIYYLLESDNKQLVALILLTVCQERYSGLPIVVNAHIFIEKQYGIERMVTKLE